MAILVKRKTLVLGLMLAALAAALVGLSAGEMEPWAPPGPTWKPLTDIEPRRVIWSEQLTADGPYLISQPGSYYLGESIDATGRWGIEIAASNVTLDLNGFALSNGFGVGIRTDTSDLDIENVVVRNGTVSGWDSHGIEIITYYGNNQVIDVMASDNGGTGIVSMGHIVDCAATGNGADGIYAGGFSIVRGCRAINNANNGIQVGSSSTISNSLAHLNGASGIRLWGDVLAVGNHCVDNDEAGIRASNDGNRIDGNQVMRNTYGIHVLVDGFYSLIIRNSAWGNSIANYGIPPGNDTGPIGSATQSTSPWANFDD